MFNKIQQLFFIIESESDTLTFQDENVDAARENQDRHVQYIRIYRYIYIYISLYSGKVYVPLGRSSSQSGLR